MQIDFVDFLGLGLFSFLSFSFLASSSQSSMANAACGRYLPSGSSPAADGAAALPGAQESSQELESSWGGTLHLPLLGDLVKAQSLPQQQESEKRENRHTVCLRAVLFGGSDLDLQQFRALNPISSY